MSPSNAPAAQAGLAGPPAAAGLVHEALFYDGPDDLAEQLAGFVRAALFDGAPALAALPTANLERLRAGLADQASGVRFVDMAEAGRNPGRILPGVLHAFAEEHDGRPVRIIGEPVWDGRSAAAYPACVQHEAAVNLALAGRPVHVLCPYDVARLPADWLEDAAATHPVVVSAGQRRTSAGYRDPADVLATFDRPLPPPPAAAVRLPVDLDVLPGIRATVAAVGAAGRIDRARVSDLQIAVNEVAANAIIHGRTPAVLRAWTDPDGVVCEVQDAGQLTDRLAGRLPPTITSERGRGLVLVNLLCDLVRMRTAPGETVVRMHMFR